MDVLLNAGGTLKDWRLVKVASFLTTDHVFTTDLYGETMALPPFWATYILQMEITMSEATACNQLETLPSSQIWWADVNSIIQYNSPMSLTNNNYQPPPPPPNDPYYATNSLGYSYQGSLNPVSYPDAHINVVPVWELGVTGSDDIRVAVFDTGISFEHEDFQGNGTYGGLSGSVVEGGFIAGDNGSLLFMDDGMADNNGGINGHGSMVAGIIGALRNNSPSADGCSISGTLVGTAYEIIVPDGPNEFIPNNGSTEEFPRMIVSILVEDPENSLSDDILLEATEEEKIAQYLRIHPNPGKGNFNLHYKTANAGSSNLHITNLSGKSVVSLQLPDKAPGKHIEPINLSHLPPGIYFCTLENNGHVTTQKLIKQ
jgi:hypothetical protein